MEKAIAYCTATQGLGILLRDERNIVADAQSARTYHMQALTDELKASNWTPKIGAVGDAPIYVLPRTRKVVAPFTLKEVLGDLQATIAEMTEDSERSIDEVVAELILQKYTQHIACGVRIVRKVSNEVREAARPVSNALALEKVVELDERLKTLRQPFKDKRKSHQKTKRLLEPDVMQTIGDIEQSVTTSDGSFVLKCRTHRRPGKFSAKELTRAVKDATVEFVEGHSLDDVASRATVHAVRCNEFVAILSNHLSQTADDALEDDAKVKLQCVRG